VDLVALGQIGYRRLFPHRLQGNLRLQGRVNLASRLRHGSLRLSNGAADFQLSPWSQKPGPSRRVVGRENWRPDLMSEKCDCDAEGDQTRGSQRTKGYRYRTRHNP
jgi:hypothetical protein